MNQEILKKLKSTPELLPDVHDGSYELVRTIVSAYRDVDEAMDNQIHNQIVSLIWSIADDCLCDVYMRGKHRDVILPMTVDNRLDAMFEDAKQAAELWGISARRVALLCAQGRILGTVKAGKTWMLPLDAQKPLDPRLGKAATDKLKN